MRFKCTINTSGVLAGVHAIGLAAITAMLEALTAGTVATLGEPELTSMSRELSVLRRHGRLRNIWRTVTSRRVATVVVALVTVGSRRHIHAFQFLHHLSLIIERDIFVQLL